MTPEYKWLATQIVRCAERWPDRIGPKGASSIDGQRCLVATIFDEDPPSYMMATRDEEAKRLGWRAFPLNDAGHRWGDIPKLLGLVPGELKEEVTCENDSRADAAGAGAADIVCVDVQPVVDHAGDGQRGDLHGPDLVPHASGIGTPGGVHDHAGDHDGSGHGEWHDRAGVLEPALHGA